MKVFRRKHYETQLEAALTADEAEQNKSKRNYKNRPSKMILIDDILGLNRDKQELIDPFYYEDFV